MAQFPPFANKKKVGKESEPDVDNFSHYNAQNQKQDHITLHSVNIQFLPQQSGLVTAWRPSYLLFLHMLNYYAKSSNANRPQLTAVSAPSPTPIITTHTETFGKSMILFLNPNTISPHHQ